MKFVYNETQGNVAVKPGDIRYQDTNLDGLLNWKDQVEIGQGSFPHWIGGFNMDLAYKNFDLTAFFQGAFGFNQTVRLRWGTNYSELMYNERWTPDNNNADGLIPRLSGSNTNTYTSDFYTNEKYISTCRNPNNLHQQCAEKGYFTIALPGSCIALYNLFSLEPHCKKQIDTYL